MDDDRPCFIDMDNCISARGGGGAKAWGQIKGVEAIKGDNQIIIFLRVCIIVYYFRANNLEKVSLTNLKRVNGP